MNARVSHQVTDEGVLLVLRPMIGSPSSLRVSEAEAKRFAFALLGDLEPDGAYGEVGGPSGGILTCGAITVDIDCFDVRVGGKRVHLTHREFQVMAVLARRPGMPLSKGAIHDHLYDGRDGADIKIIDVLICKIRNKLKPAKAEHQIETVWGSGYRLVDAMTIEAYLPRPRPNGPPSPVQNAIFSKLGGGSATFPEIWASMPMAAEASVRNALAVLVNRGDLQRTGEPKRAVYALADTLATGRVG